MMRRVASFNQRDANHYLMCVCVCLQLKLRYTYYSMFDIQGLPFFEVASAKRLINSSELSFNHIT